MFNVSFTGGKTCSCQKFAEGKERKLAEYLEKFAQQKKEILNNENKSVNNSVKKVCTENTPCDSVEIKQPQRKARKKSIFSKLFGKGDTPAHVKLLNYLLSR